MFNHGLLTAQPGRAVVLGPPARSGTPGQRILHGHDNIDIVGFRVAVTQRFSMLGFEYFSAADDQRARETQLENNRVFWEI